MIDKFTKGHLINALLFNEDEAKIVMKAQRQFPETLTLDVDMEGFIVDARTLWVQLGKPQGEFNKWSKRKIVEKTFFEENSDYLRVDRIVDMPNNAKRLDMNYTLTLDCAKNVCMMENTENGQLCRSYFILMEKAIRKGIDWNKVRHPEKQSYKEMCGILDKQYLETHPNVQKTPPYIYSNDADMINKALFGYKAKQIKAIFGEEVGVYEDATRDNLQLEANKAINYIQERNIDMILDGIAFAERKETIERTCKRRYENLKMNVTKEFNKELKVA